MTAQVVDVEIAMTGASPASATAMGELLRSLGEDAGEWKYVHRPRQAGIPIVCDGSLACTAPRHIQGCSADIGRGTCVAIEANRQARTEGGRQ